MREQYKNSYYTDYKRINKGADAQCPAPCIDVCQIELKADAFGSHPGSYSLLHNFIASRS
jgi:hypothetical protein